MSNNNTMTLTDAVRKVAGDHFKALETEFVDFANDMRVASPWEMMDLGLDRDTVDRLHQLVKEVFVGKSVEEALAEALA